MSRHQDLLYGSRAIAEHLGVSKAVAVHLIRSKLIPWFGLGGVACARRSTLAAHFAALESNGCEVSPGRSASPCRTPER